MTLQLLLGCNLVSLLATRLIILLWLAVVAVVAFMGVAGAQVDCLRLQFLYLLELRTQLQ
jgi:hypothetical protein